VQLAVPVQMRTYFPATLLTLSENVTTKFAPTATLVASSSGDRLDTVGAMVSLHTAYSVAAAFAEYVAPAAYAVPPHEAPTAGCVVHHPPKLYPDLVNDPEFVRSVRFTA
jgi:hypothetical protein